MDPYIIDSLVSSARTPEILDGVPLDHFLLIKVISCKCHGSFGLVSFVPLSETPAGIRDLRPQRTEISLPIVITDEDGKVVHVRTIHWDEPRPVRTMPMHAIRINSRGGMA